VRPAPFNFSISSDVKFWFWLSSTRFWLLAVGAPSTATGKEQEKKKKKKGKKSGISSTSTLQRGESARLERGGGWL